MIGPRSKQASGAQISLCWSFKIPGTPYLELQLLLHLSHTLGGSWTAMGSCKYLTATNTYWEVFGGFLCSSRLESTRGPPLPPNRPLIPSPFLMASTTCNNLQKGHFGGIRKETSGPHKKAGFSCQPGIYYPHLYKLGGNVPTHDPRIPLEFQLPICWKKEPCGLFCGAKRVHETSLWHLLYLFNLLHFRPSSSPWPVQTSATLPWSCGPFGKLKTAKSDFARWKRLNCLILAF